MDNRRDQTSRQDVSQPPDDVDQAPARDGLAPGDIGRVLVAAAAVLAAWQECETWAVWDAWSRSPRADALMDELEEALETFAPAEGDG